MVVFFENLKKNLNLFNKLNIFSNFPLFVINLIKVIQL